MKEKNTPLKDRSDYRDSTLKGFCSRNGISEPTGYKQIRLGLLDARKLGRITYISVEAERAWRDALPKFTEETKKRLAAGMIGV